MHSAETKCRLIFVYDIDKFRAKYIRESDGHRLLKRSYIRSVYTVGIMAVGKNRHPFVWQEVYNQLAWCISSFFLTTIHTIKQAVQICYAVIPTIFISASAYNKYTEIATRAHVFQCLTECNQAFAFYIKIGTELYHADFCNVIAIEKYFVQIYSELQKWPSVWNFITI